MPHYTLEDSGTTLRFVMPNRKHWLLIVMYIIFFIPIISLCSPNLLSASFWGDLQWIWEYRTPLLIYTLIALLFVILPLVELLWQLVGKEVVEVTDDYIKIRHQVLFFGISRKCQASRITGIDITIKTAYRQAPFFFTKQLFFLTFLYGRVTLNTGRTFLGINELLRFGLVLDEDEAGQIVLHILQRFPQYKYPTRKAGQQNMHRRGDAPR